MKLGLIGIFVLAAAAACGGDANSPALPDSAAALVLVIAGPEEPGRPGLALRGPDGALRALTPGCASAWSPCVSHDAQRLCFLGRETPSSPVRLFVAGVDGSDAAVCAAEPDEDSAPAWLPDGRVVFAAAAADGSRALFVITPPSGEARRITFCGTDARDPTVLSDGRILYVGKSFEQDAGGRPALFGVHPDGTGGTLVHARTRARAYARPRQAADGTIVFLAHGEKTQACTLDWRAPHEPSGVLPVPGGTVAVEPLPAGSWAALVRQGQEAKSRLVLVSPYGTASPLPAGGAAELLDHCFAGVRPRPQGHLSMVKEEAEHGQLLCLDARVEAARGLRARLHVRTGAAAAADWRPLGDVSLAGDGSFFVQVPADVPLRLDVIDSAGAVVSGTRTPFWVRPSEVRGCIGCHTPPDATPPNRMPHAALHDPLDLTVVIDKRRIENGAIENGPIEKGAAR